MLVENEVMVAIQVLGKLRETISVAKGLPREELARYVRYVEGGNAC